MFQIKSNPTIFSRFCEIPFKEGINTINIIGPSKKRVPYVLEVTKTNNYICGYFKTRIYSNLIKKDYDDPPIYYRYNDLTYDISMFFKRNIRIGGLYYIDITEKNFTDCEDINNFDLVMLRLNNYFKILENIYE